MFCGSDLAHFFHSARRGGELLLCCGLVSISFAKKCDVESPGELSRKAKSTQAPRFKRILSTESRSGLDREAVLFFVVVTWLAWIPTAASVVSSDRLEAKQH